MPQPPPAVAKSKNDRLKEDLILILPFIFIFTTAGGTFSFFDDFLQVPTHETHFFTFS